MPISTLRKICVRAAAAGGFFLFFYYYYFQKKAKFKSCVSRRFRVISKKCQFPHTAENSGLLQLAVSSFFFIIIIFRKKQSLSHVAAEDFGLLQLTVCSFFFIIITFRKSKFKSCGSRRFRIIYKNANFHTQRKIAGCCSWRFVLFFFIIIIFRKSKVQVMWQQEISDQRIQLMIINH